jgi:hybrid cluster-associated redox disulfide protein
MDMPTKITAKMPIGQILKSNPDALKTLEQYGLSCADCALNSIETLEEGAKSHGLSPDEIKTLAHQLSGTDC